MIQRSGVSDSESEWGQLVSEKLVKWNKSPYSITVYVVQYSLSQMIGTKQIDLAKYLLLENLYIVSMLAYLLK